MFMLSEERIQYQDYFFLLDQPLTLGFGHTKYGYEVESDEEAGPETTQTRFFCINRMNRPMEIVKGPNPITT